MYKKQIASLLSDSVKMQSLILKLLHNLCHQKLQQSRISKDDLYNLHEIAYDVSGLCERLYNIS